MNRCKHRLPADVSSLFSLFNYFLGSFNQNSARLCQRVNVFMNNFDNDIFFNRDMVAIKAKENVFEF